MRNLTFYLSLLLNILFICGFFYIVNALGGFSYLISKMKTKNLAGVYEHRKNHFMRGIGGEGVEGGTCLNPGARPSLGGVHLFGAKDGNFIVSEESHSLADGCTWGKLHEALCAI